MPCSNKLQLVIANFVSISTKERQPFFGTLFSVNDFAKAANVPLLEEMEKYSLRPLGVSLNQGDPTVLGSGNNGPSPGSTCKSIIQIVLLMLLDFRVFCQNNTFYILFLHSVVVQLFDTQSHW